MPGHESFDRDFDDEEDDRAQTDWKLKNPTSSQEARNWEAKRLREQLVGDKRLAELRTEREGRERSDVLFLQVGLNVYDVMQLVCVIGGGSGYCYAGRDDCRERGRQHTAAGHYAVANGHRSVDSYLSCCF